MSDEALIKKHDIVSVSIADLPDHYRAELARREQDRQTKAMRVGTQSMHWPTTTIPNLFKCGRGICAENQ
jgi:hypothetical protein